MFCANIFPGQGFQRFIVQTRKSGVSSTGRVITSGYKDTETSFFGILAEASQREKEEWRQNQHPITHTLVQYGAQEQAKTTDYLVSEHDRRRFYVQGAENAGSLNVSMIYYVEERFDMK